MFICCLSARAKQNSPSYFLANDFLRPSFVAFRPLLLLPPFFSLSLSLSLQSRPSKQERRLPTFGQRHTDIQTAIRTQICNKSLLGKRDKRSSEQKITNKEPLGIVKMVGYTRSNDVLKFLPLLFHLVSLVFRISWFRHIFGQEPHTQKLIQLQTRMRTLRTFVHFYILLRLLFRPRRQQQQQLYVTFLHCSVLAFVCTIIISDDVCPTA